MKKELLIDIPKLTDERGNLSFIEAEKLLPFSIEQTYWIYDIPREKKHHESTGKEEFIIALSGSFDTVIDDGYEKRTYTLNKSHQGLYIPNMMRKSIENFSADAVCLILTSESYCDNKFLQKRNVLTDYSPIYDLPLIQLPTLNDKEGNISIVNGKEDIPFDIKRVFYIYDIPSETVRGMHAHKTCDEILIAVNGSFEVELDDGKTKKNWILNNPNFGLLIPRGVWATQRAYSSGAICLVLASEPYNPENYINTYSDFKKYREDGDENL